MKIELTEPQREQTIKAVELAMRNRCGNNEVLFKVLNKLGKNYIDLEPGNDVPPSDAELENY